MGRLGFLILLVLWSWTLVPGAPPVMPFPVPTPAGGNVPPGALPPGFMGMPNAGGLQIPGMLLPDHLSRPLMRHATFEGSGSIRGVVMDRDHDKPVPDATVVLLSLLVRGGVLRETPSDSVITNAKGEFVFERLPAGRYFVEAYHGPGMLVPWHDPDVSVPMIQVEEGKDIAGLVCHVYGGHRVLVRLKGTDLPEPDAGSGRMQMGGAIHDIWIRRESLRVEGGMLMMGGGIGSGNVRISGHEMDFRGIFGPSVGLSLSFGHFWARGADGERLDSLKVELPRDQYEVEVELNLESPPILRGQITRAGEGVRGPGVVTWRPSRHGMFIGAGQSVPTSVVSGEGAFSIEIPGRRDGTLEFVLENEEPIHYGVLPFRRSFPEHLEVKVPEPGSLKVRVVGEDDAPAAGATVWATMDDARGSRSGSDPVPRVIFLPHQPALPEEANDPFEESLHRRFEAVADGEGIAVFPRMSAESLSVRAFGAPGSRLAPSEDTKVTIAFGKQSETEIKLEGFKPFAGVVHDEDGKPISDALVSLGRAANVRGRPTESVPESRTDEAGRFRFENVGPRDVREVYVSLLGVQGRRASGKFTPGQEDAVITLQALPTTSAGAVRLRVYDQITGEPVPHATLLDWQGRPLANFTRTPDGQLEIPGARDNPPLEGYLVTAVGYAREAVYFQGITPSTSRVQLVPTSTLRGRVIDEAAKLPVPEASVEYSLWLTPPFGGPPRPSPFQTQTDGDGRFELVDVPVWLRSGNASRNMMETRHLRIEAGPDFAPRYLPITTEGYGLTDLGDVEMNAGLKVAVRVMLEGKPVSDEPILLSVEPVPTMMSGGLVVTKEASTDAQGWAVIPKVPPGRATVTLTKRNLNRGLMPYEARYPIAITIGRGMVQLPSHSQFGEARLSLYGDGPERLRLRGQGVGSASPWDPAEITKGATLPFGSWRFNVSTSGSNVGRARVDAELTEEAPELSLPDPFGTNTVKVRVEAEEGFRTSGLRAWMEREGEALDQTRVRHEGMTNNDGEATLHKIPAGEYRVVVLPQGNVKRWFTAKVVVVDTVEEQLVTALPAEEGGTVVIRAVCAETGAPLEKWLARVAIAPENWEIASGMPNDDGSVVFENVPRERLQVSATSIHWLRDEVELARSFDGQREVMLRLQPGGSLRLEIEAISPEDAATMQNWSMDTGIELVRRDAPDRLVDFWMIHPRFTPMNPNRAYAQGDYLVRFLNEGRLVEEREIEIKVGQTLVLPVHWAEKRLGVASSEQ